MNEFDLDNLDQAVTDFQKTIDALRSIQTISDRVIDAAGQIGASGADIKKDAEKMSELSGKIADEVQRFSGEVNSHVHQVEQFFQEYGETVTKAIADTAASTDSLREENEKLEKKVQDYMVNTQKSLDEVRIVNNNNTRELREKLGITVERIRSEVGGRLGLLKELEEELDKVKAQQKKTEKLVWIGVVGAVIAALSSLLQFVV